MIGFLDSAQMLEKPCQIVLIGYPNEPSYRMMEQFLASLAIVDMVMISCFPEQSLPVEHPAYAKTMIGGKPTVYICSNYSCSPPFTDAGEIAAYLNKE